MQQFSPLSMQRAEIYEEVVDSWGKPRLKEARKWLLDPRNLRDLGFDRFGDVLEFGEGLFTYWRDTAEYMIIQKEYVGSGDPKPTEYLAVKCSKRGNDVYSARIKDRFRWLAQEIPDRKFFEIRDFQTNKEVKTSLLWVTLTWDAKRCSLIQAWETLGKDFNRWITALRQKYGKIHSLRVWEAYESGYPHVHAILLFEDAEFSVFPHWSKQDSTDQLTVSSKLTFRIKEKREISELWHSHVDIQAISSLRNVFTYIKKHQEKILLGLTGNIQEGDSPKGFDLEGIKGLRTLFLCWIFRKRSFSVSGLFREKISDLISHLHNSNMERQLDLLGNLLPEQFDWKFTFLGIFSAQELDIPPFIWAKKLKKEEVVKLLERRS